MKKFYTLMVLCLALSITVSAQVQAPQPSPSTKVEQKVGLTNVTLEYSNSLYSESFFTKESINHDFAKVFNDYAQSHLMLSVMGNMSNAETPIKDSVPFFGFDEDRYNLHDDKNVDKVKIRKNGTFISVVLEKLR